MNIEHCFIFDPDYISNIPLTGQVLKIRKARMMCTKDGLEVRGFNHLRGVYANENTFLISSFRNKVVYEGSDLEDDDGIAPTRPGQLLKVAFYQKVWCGSKRYDHYREF